MTALLKVETYEVAKRVCVVECDGCGKAGRPEFGAGRVESPWKLLGVGAVRVETLGEDGAIDLFADLCAECAKGTLQALAKVVVPHAAVDKD
jgi:hypothetical protein